MERFEEEVCLVKAESSRVGKTFRHLAAEWKNQAEGWDNINFERKGNFEAGAASASWRRHDVFTRLAERAEWYHSQLLAHERFELTS